MLIPRVSRIGDNEMFIDQHLPDEKSNTKQFLRSLHFRHALETVAGGEPQKMPAHCANDQVEWLDWLTNVREKLEGNIDKVLKKISFSDNKQ